MTNFTSFAFLAAGSSQPRTMPDRIAEIINVKDYGAKGDGVTDDWAAIMAAYNWTGSSNRGVIFFPPGTYLVSQAINMTDDTTVYLEGVYGASTITGNFGDYVIVRHHVNGVTGCAVENLTIINTHASGGGIRWGNSIVAAIRNCMVTANQGISCAADDGLAPLSDLEFNIINCSVNPGSNVSGSNGIMSVADGVIMNCKIVGFETGARLWGNEGNMTVIGCYFERNITGIAVSAPGNIGIGAGIIVRGCWFKDNGTALFGLNTGNGWVNGCRIEASESVTVGGARPQYGIRILDGAWGLSLFTGIVVTGQYDKYAVSVEPHAGFPVVVNSLFAAVQAFNTSSHSPLGVWNVPAMGSPPTAYSMDFLECNCPASVYTMGGLPSKIVPILAISWAASAIVTVGTITPGSGGTPGVYLSVPLTGGSGTGATADIYVEAGGTVNQVFLTGLGSGYTNGNTLSASSVNIGGVTGFSVPVTSVADSATAKVGDDVHTLNSQGLQAISVKGVTTTGYNGVFSATSRGLVSGGTLMSYPVSGPLGSDSTGTMVINPTNSGVTGIYEGDTYNVTDSDVSTWGASPVGSGSTHGKVRWNAVINDWTLVGK